MKTKKLKQARKKIALERIDLLLGMAKDMLSKDPELSKRYVQIVEKMRKRFNIRRTDEMKRSYCKKCYTYWSMGKTVKVRYDKRNKLKLYICQACGKVYKCAYK